MSNLNQAQAIAAEQPISTPESKSGRLHGLDFTRGVACLTMPIYHSVHNLFVVGLVSTQWTKSTFWEIYQTLGLGTFVLVSGMAFTLSTHRGIRWHRLARRALKLAVVAAVISFATYLVMPEKFVRFGVIHFFCTTILLAPLFKPLGKWLLLPGLGVVAFAIWMTKAGLYPEPLLYITGLMSERPRSIDYIPLVPWFGVFLCGMALVMWLKVPEKAKQPATWMKSVIWLGKHSLPFYIIHQIVVFGALSGIAMLVK